eukprot:jgi/Botrbrau1/8850/Bobra.50_2s0009.1
MNQPAPPLSPWLRAPVTRQRAVELFKELSSNAYDEITVCKPSSNRCSVPPKKGRPHIAWPFKVEQELATGMAASCTTQNSLSQSLQDDKEVTRSQLTDNCSSVPQHKESCGVPDPGEILQEKHGNLNIVASKRMGRGPLSPNRTRKYRLPSHRKSNPSSATPCNSWINQETGGMHLTKEFCQTEDQKVVTRIALADNKIYSRGLAVGAEILLHKGLYQPGDGQPVCRPSQEPDAQWSPNLQLLTRHTCANATPPSSFKVLNRQWTGSRDEEICRLLDNTCREPFPEQVDTSARYCGSDFTKTGTVRPSLVSCGPNEDTEVDCVVRCTQVHDVGSNARSLIFSAPLEGGRLGEVLEVEQGVEYEMKLSHDSMNPRTCLWFDFLVVNGRAGQKVLVSIVNMSRARTAYRNGLTPWTRSSHAPKWTRLPCGSTFYTRSPTDPSKYILSFTFGFSNDDEVVEFAFALPYTYTELQRHLFDLERTGNGICWRSLLGRTVQQRRIDVLHFGTQNTRSGSPRKLAVVCARVHPGETPASFVALAMMRALVSRDADLSAFLKAATVIVVPMLNPDGCSLGNYRSDAGGCDLNRLWACANVQMEPALHHVLELLNKLSEDPDYSLELFLDLHAHANCKAPLPLLQPASGGQADRLCGHGPCYFIPSHMCTSPTWVLSSKLLLD